MASAKSVFERAITSDTSPKLSKKASKWDKPKPVPPPAVNRDAENAEQSADCELPPPAYTRNMLAKFQSLQQPDGQLINDSEVTSSKPRKLWEDELPSDKMSPSPQDDVSNTSDASGAADDTNVPDVDQASGCMLSDSPSHEVDKCDADPQVSMEDAIEPAANESETKEQECLIMEDAIEPAANESETKEQECLINLDDDDDDLSGMAAVNDGAPECHVENREGDTEGDIPSDCPSEDTGDAVASDDDTGIQEASTGEM